MCCGLSAATATRPRARCASRSAAGPRPARSTSCSMRCPRWSLASAASPPNSVRLFLFDIDGTLVSVRGAGRTAFARALEETYGTAGTIERYDFRGRTDLSIVHELMTGAGLDVERIRARVDACFQVYARELTRIIGDGSRIQVLPGVAEVVRRLGARPDAVVGLLTGNIEAGARIKLEPTGLWPLFRVAAYGGDDADRLRLPASGRAPSVTSSRSIASRSSATPRWTSRAPAAAAPWPSRSRRVSTRSRSWRGTGPTCSSAISRTSSASWRAWPTGPRDDVARLGVAPSAGRLRVDR